MIETLRMLVENYGYLAVLVGCFFEGETTIVLGVLAATQGYLHLPWVLVAAFFGTIAGDNLWLHLGRHLGHPFIARRPSWQAKADQVQRLLDRYGAWVLIGFRFFYGLRSITPFILGAARLSPLRFFLLDAAGAILWLAIVGTLAYSLSTAVEQLIGDIQDVEKMLLIALLTGIVLIAAGIALRRRLRRKRPSKNPDA